MTESATHETDVNDVTLTGRVSGEPEQRVLPSGDELVTFRLIVRRPPRRGASRSKVSVDTFDVACFGAAARRRAIALTASDVIEVQGSLRRRFFRAGESPTSRYEVEAAVIRKVRAGTAA